MIVHKERMEEALNWQILATDVADYLVRKGIPFRQAHHAVGQAVKKAELFDIPLNELPLSEWKSIETSF